MNNFLDIILHCKDDELKNIVIKRAFELEESESTDRNYIIPSENLHDYDSYYHGFIKSDVKIFSSIGNSNEECYTLNNYDYLVEFFKYIREKNVKSKSDLIKYMSSFMDNYFGEYKGIDKRADFLRTKEGTATIDMFKKTGLAACSERAAIANNILTMIGFDSFFLTGEINGEQHAFNAILTSNNHLTLIDTTHCSGLYDKDNNLIGTATYFYNLGTINNISSSYITGYEPLELQDSIARIDDDGYIRYEANGNLKKYCIEPFHLTEEENKRL